MKPTLTFILLGIGLFIQAQLTITTNLFESGIFYLDTVKTEYSEAEECNDIFIFDKDFTTLKQVTDNITYEYEIYDYSYDEGKILHKMNVYDIILGYEYELQIDGINELIIFSWLDEDFNLLLDRYHIHETFNE